MVEGTSTFAELVNVDVPSFASDAVQLVGVKFKL
jgi:hypothetical protein